jgi:superfamily II DNA or RNA helicase
MHTAAPLSAPELVFDRGTLLFKGAWPKAVGVDTLDGVLFDPRVHAYRAPAFLWRELSRELERRGASHGDHVLPERPALGAFDAIELRPYQEAALRAWELASRRGVVVLPTGSGKTRTAIAAIARTACTAICLVPTRVLLEQWRFELSKLYRGQVGCYGDGAHELAGVTVATYESAYRHMGTLGNLFDLVIVDEAHHFGANVRDEALEMTTAPSRLGLTATPPVPRSPAAERLERLVGPTVFELGIPDLAGGYLAPFDLLVVGLELAPDERSAYERDLACWRTVQRRFFALAPDGTWPELVRAASATSDGRRALAAWRRVGKLLALTRAKAETVATLLARHRDARTLIFTADNETAYALSRDHLVMPLTYDIGRDERQEALERFRRGELRALVSARVLNEGLDVPDADVAIVVGGALGAREHVQRIGRLLRPAPGKRALVYELVSRRTIEVHQSRKRRRGLHARAAAPL